MDRNEFIGKLQMVYVGDRNALNEIIREYDSLNNIIDELEKAYYKMEEKQVEIDGRGYYYTDLIPIEEIIDKLKELKGE